MSDLFDIRVEIDKTIQKLTVIIKNKERSEDQLSDDRFVRISQSEIINIQKVKSFDFSIAGTIGVLLDNGESTFVARRRVREVKQALSKNTHLYPTKEE